MLDDQLLRKALADAEREVVELEAICEHLGDMDMKRWAAKNLVSSLKNALGLSPPVVTMAGFTPTQDEGVKK